MHQPISKLWFLGPPVAILISLLAYYAKFASMRHWVDARFPWVEENIGSHLPNLAEGPQVWTAPRKPASVSSSPPAPASARAETELQQPAPPPPPAAPTFFAADGTVDVTKLAADRKAWPPIVALKKAREFPAVVNGKAVGIVAVPAGTEARLVSIQDGKLGVEYQGGGAWLSVEETDLAQRLSH